MHKAISELRASHPDAETTKAKVKVARQLGYADPTHATDLCIQQIPQQTLQELDAGSKKILAFMCARPWALAPTGHQGITWLELCMLYFVHGGTQQELDLSTLGGCGPGHSLRVVLLAFKKKARHVFQVFLTPFSNAFLKPSKVGSFRCRDLGFSNHTACIGGLPVVNDAEAKAIA